MHVLKVLGEPGGFLEPGEMVFALRATRERASESVLVAALGERTATGRVGDGRARRGARDVLSGTVDDFYERVARSHDMPRARCFAEKQFPSLIADVLAEVDDRLSSSSRYGS